MTRILWGFGWAGVVVWSLVCAAAYGVLDIVGRLFMRSADAWSTNPETVEWIWRVLNTLHSLSTWAVLVVWGLVSLAILAVPWAIDRMVGRTPSAVFVRRTGPIGTRPGAPGPANVIDLSPDQYTVRPAPTAGSTGPRIPPRG